MSERCIDASVIVKLALKGEPHRVTVRRLVRESIAAGIDLIARPLFESEVDTVIRKRVVAGMLSLADSHRAYGVLDRAPVQVVTHLKLRRRARDIAEQFNLPTVYDATYAALAELRACLPQAGLRVLDGGQGVLRHGQGGVDVREVSARLSVRRQARIASGSARCLRRETLRGLEQGGFSNTVGAYRRRGQGLCAMLRRCQVHGRWDGDL